MIIKFQEKDRWVMFGEVDHIEYEPVKHSEDPMTTTAICYESPNDERPHALYEVSFYTKNMNEATVIWAFNPIYIMNDQGRTVETI